MLVCFPQKLGYALSVDILKELGSQNKNKITRGTGQQ